MLWSKVALYLYKYIYIYILYTYDNIPILGDGHQFEKIGGVINHGITVFLPQKRRAKEV